METVSSLASAVGNQLWVPIERQITYLVYYKRNIENLRSQLATLEAKKKDIEYLVNESRNQLQEPNEEVQQWQKSVSETEVVANAIERQASEDKGCCLDWTLRYKIGKEAAKKGMIIEKLIENGKFDKISHARPTAGFIPTPVEHVEGLTSVEWAMDRLKSALSNERFKIIGVYGQAGIGKTTQMKRLNNQLIQTNQLFKKVILVTVTSNPNIQKIQDEIAHRLGLKFDPGRSDIERAYDLSTRLKQEETVLIVLDDMWKSLELSDVGIPLDHMGCKIIITTRIENVCHEMLTHLRIKMEVLSDEESWMLFKEKVGKIAEYPALQPVASLFLRECKGLPSAIVAFARKLSIEEHRIMSENAALSKLQNSLDYPKDADTKSFLVLCSLFPNDHSIFSLKLFLYGFAQGFVKVDGALQRTTNRRLSLIRRLNVPCGRGEDYAKMCDIVRDVAVSIAMKKSIKS
ncbi:hypothetical protein IFM89_013387 [Coptis chinensis]|uniref:AAA+ ATPase domain-containing protein n=1 Tax=Coptis chinensis TaxID=261450 RepID=A0A835I4S1_9MAGN|nr:hypothetical protein IFM89_013387 [Coptis chinensis]